MSKFIKPKERDSILQLYKLLQIEYSSYSTEHTLAKAHGKQIAIIEVGKLNFINTRFYYSLTGNLYADLPNESVASLPNSINTR